MSHLEAFDPSDECALFNLMPDGEYDYVVRQSHDHWSKTTGKYSIKLNLDVYDANGRPVQLDCYLSSGYKKLLAHFCKYNDLIEECKNGTLTPAMCDKKSGRCIIGVNMPEPGSKYDPKNVILDFVGQKDIKTEDPSLSDEIPF